MGFIQRIRQQVSKGKDKGQGGAVSASGSVTPRVIRKDATKRR